jgi:Leucine-rich repeat (LRR) protein
MACRVAGPLPNSNHFLQFLWDGSALDLTFCTFIHDLSPLRGAPVADLRLRGTRVTSLAPLAGLQLKKLEFAETGITDLTPISQCMSLQIIDLSKTRVIDLTLLAKLRLTRINCHDTKITSIAPLRGMPLQFLDLRQTGVRDLSPLADCHTLEALVLPEGALDLTALRRLPRLRFVSTRFFGELPAQTAEEFWKEYDAQPKPAGKK